MDTITVKTVGTLGCTILSSCVFQSLKNSFPDSKIVVYCKYPSLLAGLKEVDEILDSNFCELNNYDVDLSDYLSRRPHNSLPFQHLSKHMITYASKQLAVNLNDEYLPKLNLQNDEINQAINIVKSLSNGKPVIWLQTETNSQNRNWPKQYWEKLINESAEKYSFIDLSSQKFEPRISIAITMVCDAGIALDSFLLHGSAAVGAKNVMVILGSSRPEVVIHSDQIQFYESGNCTLQPCGMHGYSYGCRHQYDSFFENHKNTRCISDDFRCMSLITPEMIIQKLKEILN